MARYIDADKLKKRIYASPMFFHFGEDGFFIRDGVLDLIEKFPIAISTADVAEVKRGKWTLHNDGSGTCEVCGRHQKSIWDMCSWQKYCGHCGAKMDGGKAE